MLRPLALVSNGFKKKKKNDFITNNPPHKKKKDKRWLAYMVIAY